MDAGHRKPKIVAFDFDGVIAKYHHFISSTDVQDPIPEVVKAMEVLKEKGYKILIYSTRGGQFLKEYCRKYSIPFDYINRRPDKEGDNPGKPIAYVYVDDRAVCYKGQKSEELVREILNFKAHWEEN